MIFDMTRTIYVPVKGFPNYVACDEGYIYKIVLGCFYHKLPRYANHGGYRTVRLRKNKKSYTKRVHVLVWESFIGKVPKGYQINHKTGFKWMNGIFDLELTTQEQNLKHSRDLGLRQKPKIETKLDEIQVLTLYTCKKSHRRKALVEYSGTTIRNVEMILSGQSRKKLFSQVMADEKG